MSRYSLSFPDYRPFASPPAEVTACCWDTNTPGAVGLCGADGSFVLVDHEPGELRLDVQQYRYIAGN